MNADFGELLSKRIVVIDDIIRAELLTELNRFRAGRSGDHSTDLENLFGDLNRDGANASSATQHQ